MRNAALLVLASVVGLAIASSAFAQTGSFEPRYHRSRVIVWFKPGAVTLAVGKTSATLANSESFSPAARSVLSAVGAVNVRMLTPTATAANLVSEAPGSLPETAQLDMQVVELPDTNVTSALATLNGDPSVVVAEPDWEKHACLVPTDSRFAQQWWLKNTGQFGGVAGFDINATQAWDVTTGADPVDVVVIDTGVDGGHPDLIGRVYAGPNYVFPGSPPNDDDNYSSHGTSVSGIIAAQGNGGGDVVGVDWNARIVAAKALDGPSGSGSTSDIDAAVDWARVNGYKLINLSLGGPNFLRTEQVVFKNAHLAGVTCCVAMGNENSSQPDYPAGYSPYVIAVGAVDDRQNRWNDHLIWPGRISGVPQSGLYFGSNFGANIRLAAPGGRLIETTRSVDTGSYWPVALATGSTGFGGTSAATPVVTGVAALVKSLAPQLTGEDIAQVLYLTADDFNYVTGHPGFDTEIGYGLVDAEKAVAMVSGQNRIEQGATVSVADVAQQNDIWRSILSWPGIPAENYPCIRHTIRATVTFANAFISPPVVWARRLSSYGAGNENPIYDAVNVPTTDPGYGNPALVPWRPNAWSVSANSAQATFETYVYDLRDVTTATHRYWWPTAPAGVSFAYTAIGPVSLLGVPHGTSVVDEVRLSARPNPAGHGLTTLTLSVPKRDAVSLELLDVSGRLVRTIFSGTLSSGIHRYAWDLRGDDGQPVPAGLYFARCSTSRRGAAVSRVAVVR